MLLETMMTHYLQMDYYCYCCLTEDNERLTLNVEPQLLNFLAKFQILFPNLNCSESVQTGQTQKTDVQTLQFVVGWVTRRRISGFRSRCHRFVFADSRQYFQVLWSLDAKFDPSVLWA